MLLLPATLTAREARDTLRMLALAIEGQADAVVVDASSLLQFDSAALSVLLECQRQALALGKAFTLLEPPPKLTALAKLYGVDVLLMRSASAPA
ncbi:MAG: STAS domain-containing protein [Burkholderiales bacterium]|jgi:phospholipid transport system transporter-binding protein|nr:STAS domain-containing protein [Burkholderiales bacterium]